ncbi:hypothetical protein [Hydrogenophilus thiooxidans]|uniref:hypothetical protein n=1 Tax=Hydrogenophilus thiooxidans TaxID=2820326 RepID=UPI001C242300|nr:hypothetical protein [Hydrogenophilus thiooxidans]
MTLRLLLPFLAVATAHAQTDLPALESQLLADPENPNARSQLAALLAPPPRHALTFGVATTTNANWGVSHRQIPWRQDGITRLLTLDATQNPRPQTAPLIAYHLTTANSEVAAQQRAGPYPERTLFAAHRLFPNLTATLSHYRTPTLTLNDLSLTAPLPGRLGALELTRRLTPEPARESLLVTYTAPPRSTPLGTTHVAVTLDRPWNTPRPGKNRRLLTLAHTRALTPHLTLTLELVALWESRPYAPLLAAPRQITHGAATLAARWPLTPTTHLEITARATQQQGNHPLFDRRRADLELALTWRW